MGARPLLWEVDASNPLARLTFPGEAWSAASPGARRDGKEAARKTPPG
jgi:hypothetical protein